MSRFREQVSRTACERTNEEKRYGPMRFRIEPEQYLRREFRMGNKIAIIKIIIVVKCKK